MPVLLILSIVVPVMFTAAYLLFLQRRADFRPARIPFDEFRAMLFASHALEDLVDEENPKTRAFQPDTWRMLRQAQSLIDEGRCPAAVTLLEQILTVPRTETRIQIWTWNALRRLGCQPQGDIALAVQGVIFEIPVKGGLETLAVYADGHVRHVDHRGHVVICDKPTDEVAALSMGLIGLVSPWNSTLVLTDQNPLPTHDKIYVTTLSFSGTRYGSAKLEELKNRRHQYAPMFEAAMELIRALRATSDPKRWASTFVLQKV